MRRIAFLAAVLTSAPAVSAPPAAPAPAVEEVVRSFAAAGDARDLTALQTLLHPGFRVVADMGPGAVSTLDRATYLSLLEQGKIGGGARAVELSEIQVDRNIATVRATLTRTDAVFHTTWTLAQTEQRWQIVQDAVWMKVR